MKKLLLILMITPMLFISCNKDDDTIDNNNNNGTFLENNDGAVYNLISANYYQAFHKIGFYNSTNFIVLKVGSACVSYSEGLIDDDNLQVTNVIDNNILSYQILNPQTPTDIVSTEIIQDGNNQIIYNYSYGNSTFTATYSKSSTETNLACN